MRKIELTYVSLNNTGLASLGLQQSILCILSEFKITYNCPCTYYVFTRISVSVLIESVLFSCQTKTKLICYYRITAIK